MFHVDLRFFTTSWRASPLTALDEDVEIVIRRLVRDAHATDAGFSAHHGGVTSDAGQLRRFGAPSRSRLLSTN
jgi:hypothetical protein